MTTRNLTPTNSPSESGYLTWKDAQRTHQIELGEFLTIGRESGNHLTLEDDFISTRHARIERRNGVFILRDLRSRNGTYVNGARIFEAQLNDGDRIRIGDDELRFSYHKSGAPADRPAMTSKNSRWQSQIDRMPDLANSPFPILITGPSGSGKDVVAQHIHRLSERASGPFVGVNCSALSEALVESELFGHVRGSFTGATNDRKGAFEAARRGTLFLDEIGDLPLSLQPKLLRALENNQIRPVGSDRSIETDVRIIAATHRDLKQLIHAGDFRSDLYFRLHVIQLKTPSLLERNEDFEDLFYHFAKQMRVRFSHDAIAKLKKYQWPGNIRELRNVVARAKAFFGQTEVTVTDVDGLLDIFPKGIDAAPNFKPSRSVIKELEYEMIKTRLIANNGNQRRTAADLGMAKSTLNDRIRAYGIDLEELLVKT